MKFTEKLLTPALLSLALALPATAQMMTPEWDADGDAALTNDEFNAGFTTGGTFGNYDTDADGMLSETEWNTGFEGRETMFEDREYEMGAFADADANADGMLDETEYNNAWFNTYDADRSGMLEDREMGDIDTDMGEGGLFDL